MRRSSLNRFVPSRRRQIIRSFHFPLIVANAMTRSEGSQSNRGAFDFITKLGEPKFAATPSGLRPMELSHFLMYFYFSNIGRLIQLKCPRTEVVEKGNSSHLPFSNDHSLRRQSMEELVVVPPRLSFPLCRPRNCE